MGADEKKAPMGSGGPAPKGKAQSSGAKQASKAGGTGEDAFAMLPVAVNDLLGANFGDNIVFQQRLVEVWPTLGVDTQCVPTDLGAYHQVIVTMRLMFWQMRHRSQSSWTSYSSLSSLSGDTPAGCMRVLGSRPVALSSLCSSAHGDQTAALVIAQRRPTQHRSVPLSADPATTCDFCLAWCSRDSEELQST